MQRIGIIGIIAQTLFLGLALYLAPLEPSVVALQLTFDKISFLDVLHQWTPAGVARFRAHFVADFALLIAYGMFGYLLGQHLRATRRLAGTPSRMLVWALPLAACADAAENVLHLLLSAEGAVAVPAMYALAGTSASAKWLLIGVFTLSLAHTLMRRVR